MTVLDGAACELDAQPEVIVHVAAEQRTPLCGLGRAPGLCLLIRILILQQRNGGEGVRLATRGGAKHTERRQSCLRAFA